MPAEDEQQTAESQELLVAIYKAYLDDLGRIGSRHETLRAFYLSVVSALFVILSLGSATEAPLDLREGVRQLVGFVGILISVSWFLHMWGFGALFSAKVATLKKAEERLPLKPFTMEENHWDEHKRIRLTVTDRIVASIFIALFVWLILL